MNPKQKNPEKMRGKPPNPGTSRTRRKFNYEEASAGGLAGLIILVIVVALFQGLLSPVVDGLQHTNNVMVVMPGMPSSQERVDTVNWLVIGFRATAFMVLIGAGINYWVNSIREQSAQT